MFNPFQLNDINDTLNNIDNALDEIDKKITIFTQQNGRKYNTFIVGWVLDISDLKVHLKALKISNGCNGTIKQIQYDGEEQTAVQLQGNKLEIVKEYLLNTVNISKDDIVIKD